MAFNFESLTSSEKVTAVYVAYYGRAADPAGREFWANQLDQSGGDLAAIIQSFGTAEEAVQRFGSLSNEAAVSTLFRDLFNREADQAGLEFYIGELEAGRLTLQTIALDILNGAQNKDASIATNKIEAGENYTDTLVATGTSAEIEDTRLVVSGVDDTDASVDSAQAAVETVTGQRTGISVQGDVLENGTAVSEVASPAGATAVGANSSGFLGVTAGSSLVFEADGGNLSAGVDTDGNGTILVSGAGSSAVTSGAGNRIDIGRVGEGVLLLSDEATLETLQLAAGTVGRGEILISGSGTQATVTTANGGYDGEFSDEGGYVQAGRNDGSFGRIVLSDGALLEVVALTDTPNGPSMNIARNAGSRGEVVVDAATARFRQEGEIGDFGPNITVGRGGDGILDVRNGGVVSLVGSDTNISVGANRGDGEGDGTLSITGGSRVESLFFTVASQGGTGNVIVSGEGSKLVLEGTEPPSDSAYGNGAFMNLGRDGTGTLTVEEGGQVSISTDEGSFPGINLGRNEGSQGTITVTGDESSIKITNNNAALTNSSVAVGRAGTGNLTISDGASFEGSLFMQLGNEATGDGSVTVTGENSLLALSGARGPEDENAGQAAFLQIGGTGTGTLKIDKGGDVTIAGEGQGYYPGFAVGFGDGATGDMVVTGEGSSVTVSGGTDVDPYSEGVSHVGRNGTGSLTVSNGGEVTNSENGLLTVGFRATAEGTLTITGVGSSVDAGLQLFVGSLLDTSTGEPLPESGGTGQVSVEAGGTLEAGDAVNDGIADIVIGNDGALTVEAGATLIGDVRVVGGSFDLAEGATHQGELIA